MTGRARRARKLIRRRPRRRRAVGARPERARAALCRGPSRRPPTGSLGPVCGPGGPPSSAERRVPAGRARSRPTGSCRRPGADGGRAAAGRARGRPPPQSRAPRLSCTWNSRTASSTGSTRVSGLDAHEARHHVGMPDVEQHPVGGAVEALHEVADRQRVVADARAAPDTRGRGSRGRRARERPRPSARAGAAPLPPPPTRCRAGRSRARGRRPAPRRCGARTRAAPRRPGSGAPTRAGGSSGPCTTMSRSVTSSDRRRAVACRTAWRGSASISTGGAATWTQAKPAASIAFSAAALGPPLVGDVEAEAGIERVPVRFHLMGP